MFLLEENYAAIEAKRFVVSPVSWLKNLGRTVRFGTTVWVRTEYCLREVQRMGMKELNAILVSIFDSGGRFQQNFRAFEKLWCLLKHAHCQRTDDIQSGIGNQLEAD